MLLAAHKTAVLLGFNGPVQFMTTVSYRPVRANMAPFRIALLGAGYMYTKTLSCQGSPMAR